MEDEELSPLPPPENAVESSASPAQPGGSKWRWLIVAAVVVLLGFPVAEHFFSGAKEGPGQGNLLQVSALNYQNHRYREALDAARDYLKTNPDSADAYNNIAVSYLGLGQYDEATRNILEALRLNPNDNLAKHNLAWIAAERGKARGGVAPGPVPTPPPQAGAMLNLSLEHYNAKKFTECIAAAKSALSLYPGYAEAYNNMAACESGLKHYDAAIAAAQEAIRLKPDFQLARNNLAWAIKKR